ncbi:hypothetical protein Tco_1136073 [Tanacetum coccineum]
MVKIHTYKNVADLLTKAFDNVNPIKYALTINPTINTSCIKQFWAIAKAKTVNGKVQLKALVDGKKIIINESIVRRDPPLEDAEGVDCLPNATIFEQLTLMRYENISQKLTFYKAFFSPQWKFLIHTILQCLSAKTTAWNEFSSTMASAIICSANPTDPQHTPTITQPSTSQPQKKQKPRKPKRKNTEVRQPCGSTKHVADEVVYEERDDSLGFFGIFGQPCGSTKHVADEVVYEERDDSLVRAATTASSLKIEQDIALTPTVSLQHPSQVKIQDKGKAKMIEPEPVKKLSKKDQLKLDEELAFKLHAEAEEEERLVREKAQQIEEANIALKETWDDIQAKIKADRLLAERLQVKEQEELTIEEMAQLFQQLLEKRRKHFAAKRAEEKRNRPPTRAQQRSIMCTYLKNMEGWKPKDLKNKTELVKKSFKKAEAEIAQKSNSKRGGEELEQEVAKKQKVDEDKDTTKL